MFIPQPPPTPTHQAFNRSTTKYWIRTSDVSAVKRTIIENMPVFVFNAENYSGDAQLVNSVYFDNDSLELYHGRLDKKPGALAIRVRWYGPNDPSLCFVERKIHKESWKGEKSVKERFTLPEAKVVPYIEGEYTAEEYEEGLRAKVCCAGAGAGLPCQWAFGEEMGVRKGRELGRRV